MAEAIAAGQITIAKVVDGEMDVEQLEQLEQASSDAAAAVEAIALETDARTLQNVLTDESLQNSTSKQIIEVNDNGVAIAEDGSDSRLELSGAHIALYTGETQTASVYSDASEGSIMKADNFRAANVLLKNENNDVNFGWISQSNGHLTLKEV